MIRTNFRIVVETCEEDDSPLDTYALASVFKSASARLKEHPNHGLPVDEETGGEDAVAEELAHVDESTLTDDERARLRKERLRRYPTTAAGVPITPRALDIYKETFAMRRSFGIPNTQRPNIDTSSKKLPKILPETIEKLFPLSSEEQLLKAAQSKPKTQQQLIADTLDAFPRRLPGLTLRASLLHRPIWDANDEVARHNWKQIVLPQTKRAVRELQRDLLRLEVESNISPEVKERLRFDRLNLQVDPYVLSIANDETNRFADAGALLERFYRLLNAGAFGDKRVVRVDMPAIDYDALETELRAEVAAEAAQAEAEEQAEAQAEREPEPETAPEAQKTASAETETGAQDQAPYLKSPEDACGEPPADADAESAPAADSLPASSDPAEGETPLANAADPGGTEEEAEPPSHYQGASALHFAEQTLYEVRAHERDVAQARAQAAKEREEARAEQAAEGKVLAPEAGGRVWSVIFADGELAYFDCVAESFCDKPAAEAPKAAAGADANEPADAAAEQAPSAGTLDAPSTTALRPGDDPASPADDGQAASLAAAS